MGIKEDIKSLIEYLGDEDKHYQENLSIELDEKELDKAFKDIEAYARYNDTGHIFEVVVRVNDWLNSPSCVLVDEVENDNTKN